MTGKIFLNYRRADAEAWADRLFERLIKQFPRENVFMDIDGNIPLGLPWATWLDQQVAACDLMLVLIGRGWVAEFQARAAPDERDFVRVEIESALARKIPVVPVFLGDAPIPHSAELPGSVRPLLALQAARLQRQNFDSDAEGLITGVSRSISLARGEEWPPKSPNHPGTRTVNSPHRPYSADRYRSEGRIKIGSPFVHGAPEGWFLPGNGKAEWFKDHEHGPEMVVVPAGNFMMGSPDSELERFDYEGPHHKVTIGKSFAVGRHAVTRGQFAAFVQVTGHKLDGGAYVWTGREWKLDPKASWRNPGFAQDDSHPVVCVNWEDARVYVAWLSRQAGATYRLLSEAEREYVARASTTTPFWWGATISPTQANYNGTAEPYMGGGEKGEWRKATMPVGSFSTNPWGLFNVHGNVWEWCEDVWHETYEGGPDDGSAWLDGGYGALRVVRGGSWGYPPQYHRSAYRSGLRPDDRGSVLGFRVARTL